jgi:hypothetical protein
MDHLQTTFRVHYVRLVFRAYSHIPVFYISHFPLLSLDLLARESYILSGSREHVLFLASLHTVLKLRALARFVRFSNTAFDFGTSRLTALFSTICAAFMAQMPFDFHTLYDFAAIR